MNFATWSFKIKCLFKKCPIYKDCFDNKKINGKKRGALVSITNNNIVIIALSLFWGQIIIKDVLKSASQLCKEFGQVRASLVLMSQTKEECWR